MKPNRAACFFEAKPAIIPAMFNRSLKIALILAFLCPKTHAAPPLKDWLPMGAVACSVLCLAFALNETRRGDNASSAGNEASDRGSLNDAVGFYSQSMEHYRRSFFAEVAGGVIAGSFLYWLLRDQRKSLDSYSSAHLTHIPAGVTLYEDGWPLEVENGSAQVYRLHVFPKVIVAKREDRMVPLSPSGELKLAFPLGQHLKIRVDRLIANHATTSVE